MIEKGISVIIACYNSSDRLPTTIEHIVASKFSSPEIKKELIIIDNASSDNTYIKATELCETLVKPEWGNNYIVRKQPLKGKNHALSLAFSLCSYSYACIIDDDNWVSPDFFQNAFDIIERNPDIGALGGLGIAEFESQPPEWGKNGFSCGPQGNTSGDITDSRGWVFGAGCIYRYEYIKLLRDAGFKECLGTIRGHKVDVSGEDVELCYALILLGKKIWYDETLIFKHFMPAGRVNESKYLSLRRGDGVQSFVLSLYTKAIRHSGSVPSLGLLGLSHLKDICYSAFILMKRVVTTYHSNSLENQGCLATTKYRLLTLLNLRYCLNNFRQFQRNIRVINQIKGAIR